MRQGDPDAGRDQAFLREARHVVSRTFVAHMRALTAVRSALLAGKRPKPKVTVRATDAASRVGDS